MKTRLGLSDAQAEAIKTALIAKADATVQIYKGGENGTFSGQEQHDQFQKLNADTDQTVASVLDQNQLAAFEQMNNEDAIAFAKSWADKETAGINRLCKLTPEQKEATAKVIASLPAEQGGPASLALGTSALDARQGLEGRLHALEGILTPEQLEKYRQERLQEIEMYETGLRAFGVPNPTPANR